MAYTVAQLKQAAYNAGFRGAALTVAVAVSLAENGARDPSAVSGVNTDGSRDHGAFQINDKAHADLIAAGNVNDLQSNADMAYSVYKSAGGNFRPWSTYNSGAYSKNLTTAQKATTPTGSSLGGLIGNFIGGAAPVPAALNLVTGNTGLGGVTSAVSNAGNLAGHLLDPAFWKRVGLGVLAFIVLAVGVTIMLESNKSIRTGTVKGAEVAAVA